MREMDTKQSAAISFSLPDNLDVAHLWSLRWKRREMMHARWAGYSLRCIRWEFWPLDVWMRLADAVEASGSTLVEKNLFHPAAKPVLEKLEDDFCAIALFRSGRTEVAATVQELAELLDKGFKPRDMYMRTFVEVLRSFLLAVLVKSLSAISVQLAQREMRARKIVGSISVRPRPRKGRPAPQTTSVLRIQAITVCLKELRVAAELELDPYCMLPPLYMETVRVANTCLHALLFQDDLPGDRALGIMYFMSAVGRGTHPMQAIYIQIAEAIL